MRTCKIRRWAADWIGIIPAIFGIVFPIALILVVPVDFWLAIPSDKATPSPEEEQEQFLADLKKSGTPVQKAFASGEFSYGDPVDKLLTKYRPDLTVRHDPYITVIYLDPKSRSMLFPPLKAVAIEGKLVSATAAIRHSQGDTISNIFGRSYDIFAPPDYDRSYHAALDRQWEQLPTLLLAVAGSAATIEATHASDQPCETGP